MEVLGLDEASCLCYGPRTYPTFHNSSDGLTQPSILTLTLTLTLLSLMKS